MKTLEVTDEQHAFIQHLRQEIAEQVVGRYGYVRECDAIQFLIDNLDGDLDIDGEFDADVLEDLAAADDEGGDGETVDFDEDEATADGSDDADEATDDGADEAAASGGGSSGDGSASDDDMLDRMMNLLETHEEKWEESPSADYRYRVELPDGSTEDVQTKDDVRALLFKHY